jgi:hypothetical protein
MDRVDAAMGHAELRCLRCGARQALFGAEAESCQLLYAVLSWLQLTGHHVAPVCTPESSVFCLATLLSIPARC